MQDQKSDARLQLLQSIAGYIARYYREPEEVCMQAIRLRPCKSCAVADAAPCAPKDMSLEELLEQADEGFTENLLRRMDATGKKDSQIYKKANLSRQHFSKIRNNAHYQPTKATALALAIALELDLEETGDLIGRAGYTLTNSSKFDLIIRYCIENRNYSIQDINSILYEFDQPLLGG